MGGRDLGTGVPKLYRCASLEVEDEKEHRRSPPPSSTGTRLSRPRSSRTAAAGAPRQHILRQEGLRAALFQEHHPAGGRRRRGLAGAAPAPKP